MSIRILVVDDHEIVREGLIALLRREPDLDVVCSADSGERALAVLDDCDPDVVVIDHQLPGMDGLALCRELAERKARAQIVMLSGFLVEDAAEAALMAGARAYAVKDVEADELKQAIRAAARGETWVDARVKGRFAGWRSNDVPRGPLSPTLVDVLRLLAEGRSTPQIAEAMRISPHTVKGYTRRIYDRLGVNSRTEAAAVALRQGLV